MYLALSSLAQSNWTYWIQAVVTHKVLTITQAPSPLSHLCSSSLQHSLLITACHTRSSTCIILFTDNQSFFLMCFTLPLWQPCTSLSISGLFFYVCYLVLCHWFSTLVIDNSLLFCFQFQTYFFPKIIPTIDICHLSVDWHHFFSVVQLYALH